MAARFTDLIGGSPRPESLLRAALRGALTGSERSADTRTEHDDQQPRALAADGPLPAGLQLPALLTRAEQHRVLPWVARLLLRHPELDRPIRDALLAHRADLVHSQLRAVHDLALVAGALAAAEVEWLLVKGLALAELVYPTPELRSFNDLDVVVRPADFGTAITALEHAGGRLLDRNWPLIRHEMRGQLHLALPSGRVVDLHWSLLNRGTVRDRFMVPTDVLLAAAVPVTVSGTPLRTLDPTSTLLHLCLHAALSGGERLIWLKDIDLAVSRPGTDWEAVQAGAARWRARAVVGAMLHRSRTAIGTPVPDQVLRGLLPPAMRPGIAALDLCCSAYANPSRSFLLALASPTLGDRGLHVSPRLRRNLALRPGRRPATDVTRGTATPAAERAGRRAYLAAVGSGRGSERVQDSG